MFNPLHRVEGALSLRWETTGGLRVRDANYRFVR